MAAHITYLSEAALQRKFGRNLQNRDALSFEFAPDFQIESYLHHQGATFVDRFDANSYLYITRAMDYFDLAADYGGMLAEAFRGIARRASASSPSPATGCFRPAENKRIAHALNAVAAQGQLRRDRDRQAAMTPSCWTSRRCSPPCAAFSIPWRRTEGVA